MILISACLLCMGCQRRVEIVPYRTRNLVNSVTVEDQSGNRILYRNPEKVTQILRYFRGLESQPSSTDQIRSPDRMFRILFDDGHIKTYYLVDNDYVKTDNGFWMAITAVPTELIQEILEKNPTDEIENPGYFVLRPIAFQ